MSKKYICPVCGFDELKESPYSRKEEPSYEICPCCGFEFGFDENSLEDKYTFFRLRWIENGARWFISERKPKDWNLDKQLKNIK